MTSVGVIWEEPSSRPTTPGIWIKQLTPLKEFPGRWARVREAPSKSAATSHVYNLRHGRVRIPEGKFEFRADGIYIYARYIGPKNV